MEAVRDKWTDERLDDLIHRVDRGFTEVNGEFRTLRLETQAEFRALRGETQTEFAAVRSEFNGQLAQLNRTILQLFGGMIATVAIGFIAILTQL